MRIGIDMRMAGTGEGIGRYIEEIVRHLGQIDRENEYFLLVNKFSIFNFQFSNFKQVEVKSRYYSPAEQTRFIFELLKLKLDLVHFPSFNVPIFYPGRFVVTIHDLIHHFYPGKKKSRWFHRLAYKFVMWFAIHRASTIIAVSQTTKRDIMDGFGVSEKKIRVIYEAVDKKFFEPVSAQKAEAMKRKYGITKPFFLFCGVWRQYKNLPKLARAFDILKERGFDYQLVLAGKIDSFNPEIREEVFSIKNASDVLALGFVPEEDLPALYHEAAAFVLPSLMEGFGLITLEAQAAGALVVCSDIPVLHEILGDSAWYFDPTDEKQMARVIADALAAGKAGALPRRYDWSEAAKQTLESYKS